MKKTRFEDLNISFELSQAVKDMGFEETTPIQAKTISLILEGKDLIGQAQTGTGKTAAFGIPILEKVNPDNPKPQALVLCPTRELAIQVAEELKRLGTYKRRIRSIPIYGGQPIEVQIRALKSNSQIIIGTPGRIMDHLKRGTLKFHEVKTLVLDEADVMLDMGFIEDIETILQETPKERQTLFFSATIPEAILKLRKKYQRDSLFIKVVSEELTVPGVKQYYYEVGNRFKFELLTRLMDLYRPKLALVFCNTRKMVEELNSKLNDRGYRCEALHGVMKQNQRDRVMDRFRNGSIEMMVATDVAARGIDVEHVDIVFNYDLPKDMEYYVHRIGRTARVGRSGKALSFIVGKDIFRLKDIQRYARTKILRQQVPSLQEIQELKIQGFCNGLKEELKREDLGDYLNMVKMLEEDNISSKEIAALLLKRCLTEKNGERKEEDLLLGTGGHSGMVRLYINIGKKERINPRHIVGAIANETGIPGSLIGAINIYQRFSFVEVPAERARDILELMENNYINGNKIHVEPAREKKANS